MKRMNMRPMGRVFFLIPLIMIPGISRRGWCESIASRSQLHQHFCVSAPHFVVAGREDRALEVVRAALRHRERLAQQGGEGRILRGVDLGEHRRRGQ